MEINKELPSLMNDGNYITNRQKQSLPESWEW